MARHRDFGAPADMRREAVTFSLAGEDFTCLPEAPSGVLNDLIAGVEYTDDGDRQYSAPNLIEFVAGVLRERTAVAFADGDELPDGGEVMTPDEALAQNVAVPEGDHAKVLVAPADDVKRFRALMRDKRRIVPIDTLGELVIWLSEELGNRPTGPSASSRRGRR